MEIRNKDLESRFKRYLFKGDSQRFKDICKEIGVNSNLKLLIKSTEVKK